MNDEFEDVVRLYVDYWDDTLISAQKCECKTTGRWKVDHFLEDGSSTLLIEVNFDAYTKEKIEVWTEPSWIEKLLFISARTKISYEKKLINKTLWYNSDHLQLMHKRIGKVQECTTKDTDPKTEEQAA